DDGKDPMGPGLPFLLADEQFAQEGEQQEPDDLRPQSLHDDVFGQRAIEHGYHGHLPVGKVSGADTEMEGKHGGQRARDRQADEREPSVDEVEERVERSEEHTSELQ